MTCARCRPPMPQLRRFARSGWRPRAKEGSVAGVRLNEMLKAWGVAGRAAILMLCVLVAAQSAGAFAASTHGHRSCHDERAASGQMAHSEGHDHADHRHASSDRAQAESKASRQHDETAPPTDGIGGSHGGGCCGWLCSAAMLPPFPMVRPAYVSGSAVASSPADAPQTARPRGLFRPPRMSPGIIA